METNMTLEEEFEKHIREQHRIAKQATGYKAPAFINMVNERGALQTAHSLLVGKTKIHEGLTQLVLHQRLDLSLEANVIKPKWRQFFSDTEIQIAIQRLKQLNYSFPNEDEKPNINTVVAEMNQPERRSYETNAIVRNQGLPKQVKDLYKYKCQVCETRLEIGNYWYSEAAHIRPLGSQHNGDDDINNLLCLCPNHHKLFDLGGFCIEDDMSIPMLNTTLHIEDTHKLNVENIKYHREWCKSQLTKT